MILGATPGLLERFDREARSTGSLQHQNTVTIYEFGDQDGSPYLVMEYLEGSSLDAAITSGRAMSLATKLSTCVDVCNGLNYAHDRGIIHRDIKPGNVMLLDDGNVKIVDFGIARIGDTGISRTEVVGSLHYMSPEQFQSQPLDRRTDIFSTGSRGLYINAAECTRWGTSWNGVRRREHDAVKQDAQAIYGADS